MNALEGTGDMAVSKVPFDKLQSMAAGAPVVAVQNIRDLQQFGLSSGIHFGIASHNARVIFQECRCNDMHAPRFEITSSPINTFCPIGWTLYTIEYKEGKANNLEAVSNRAERAMGNLYLNLRSYPGDDFVYECLFSHSIMERCETDPSIGQHWWTPLYYTASELLELAEEATDIKLPKLLPGSINPELLHFIHHGIAIEDNWVIHFATSRVPERKNRIKLDTIATFCDITPNTEPGGPLPYKRDTAISRELARNRAVWIYCHEKEWGRYNLIWNNCEHMSRMCKVGHKQSRQVQKTIGKIALAGVGTLLPQSNIIRIASLGLPFLLNGILQGRIMQNTPPLPFESEQN